MWKKVVLIPKGCENFRGIYFIKVPWKTVTGIMNCWLALAIDFHATLHGFHVGKVMGNAYLEAKLI